MSSRFSVGQVWLHRDGSVMLVLTEPRRVNFYQLRPSFDVVWLHRDSPERPTTLYDDEGDRFCRGFKKRIL